MNPQLLPPLNFLQSIKICFKGYCKFNGRARRSEFWYFYLLCAIINVILVSILYSLFTFKTYSDYWGYYRYEWSFPSKYIPYLIFVLIVDLVLLIPLLAASTRRLHDIGYTGCNNFFMLIPFGAFYLLYLWSRDSAMGPNIFGQSPKYIMPVNDPLVNNVAIPVVAPVVQPVAYQPSQPINYSSSPGIPVAQPNVYQGQQQIPVAQPNVYQGQQQIPVAQSNTYQDSTPNAFPDQQQQIPVAQPNAGGEQPNMYPSLDGKQ